MKSTRLHFVWYAAPAVFAVVCAGALGGSSIGSTTSLKKPTKVLPDMSGNSAIGDYQPSDSRKLPNHYPLVTPSGTIPVAELARHGRLRNSRNEWRGPFDESGVDTKQEWELDNNEIDRLADWHPTNNRATEAFDRAYQSDRTKNAFSENAETGSREANAIKPVRAKRQVPDASIKRERPPGSENVRRSDTEIGESLPISQRPAVTQ